LTKKISCIFFSSSFGKIGKWMGSSKYPAKLCSDCGFGSRADNCSNCGKVRILFFFFFNFFLASFSCFETHSLNFNLFLSGVDQENPLQHFVLIVALEANQTTAPN
jgi:hypothetical protein